MSERLLNYQFDAITVPKFHTNTLNLWYNITKQQIPRPGMMV